MEHLVIIGNGIAGVTIARNVRKLSNMQITIISSESKYFFSRTALMYIFMGHMTLENTQPYEDWFWEKNRINLVYAHVDKIDFDNNLLHLNNNSSISYDKLVIATGSKSNKFGWPGQDLPGVQGLYSLQDLHLLEENIKYTNEAVIVGGGLIGIELGEMIHSRGKKVTFVIRENYYWDNILPQNEAALISRHILELGFGLKTSKNLKEILAGDNGRVCAIVTDDGEKIPCQFVGLTPGVSPNIDFVKNTALETNRGILVNDYLETNLPNVFAAGDCVEIKSSEPGARNRFEQLWYTGRMHGEVLAKTICGQRTKYERGIWFNSAKFLDIEYQTYGFVGNVLKDGEDTFYWEDKSGKKCFRVVFYKDSREIIGINTFGIRMRHEVFERWIHQCKTVDYVVENLAKANFDPEFFSKYENDIVSCFNSKYPDRKLLRNNKKNKSILNLFA